MQTLKKLLEQIYYAPDSKLPELAGQFFLHLTDTHKDFVNIKRIISPIPVDLNMWNRIGVKLRILKRLFNQDEKISSLSPELSRIINDFSKEMEKRRKRLKDIRHIIGHDSIEYYLELTNINPNTFGTKIRQFWNKLDTPENQTYLIKKSPFNLKAGHFNRQIITQELKLLSFNISMIEEADFYKGKKLRDEFDALYAAIWQYYKSWINKILSDKNGFSYSRMSSLNDFENCSLCWRFVPKKGKGDNRKPYCGFHTYDPASNVSQTEYNLALKFEHNKPHDPESPEPPPPFPGTTTKILKLLHEAFPVIDGGISRQDWIDELSRKFSRIDLNFFPDVEYNLEPLWRICPNVHRYIIEHNGDDKSPESILEILDPETPDEQDYFKHERKCMHKFFSKNFALYRIELALAESYLSEYYQYLDNHPHGGKRPRTGGKRRGAGRKPKR